MCGMKRLFIMVVGLPGSGKSEVCRIIRDNRVAVLRFGDIVKEATLERGLPYTIKNSEETAVLIRKEHGPFVISERLLRKIEATDSDVFCLDGPRDLKEMEYLEKHGSIVLFIIETPERIRFERNKRRKDSRDTESLKDFRWRDMKELGRGLGDLIRTKKYASIKIENDSDMSALEKKVLEALRRAVSEFRKGPARANV